MFKQKPIKIFYSAQEIRPRDSAIITFFQNLELGKASTMKNVISQSLGQDFVHLNVFETVNQNIPLSLRDMAIFSFSELGARQSLDR